MADADIRESIDCVVNSIRQPSTLATGDAIAMLVDKMVRKYPHVSSRDVIQCLQEGGFHSADGLKDFIEAQIRRCRK